MKSILIDILLFAIAAEIMGTAEAALSILSGIALDIPVTLLSGQPLSSILGFGLVDDIAVAILKISLATPEQIAFKFIISNGEHMAEEAYEHYSHTEEQNRRYQEYLQRENPGKTYLYGNVSLTDFTEFGASVGFLAYRGKLRTILDVGKGRIQDLFGLEETSETIELGTALV